MKQQVLVTRRADRHKDESSRDYAQTTEFEVEADDLWGVLQSLSDDLVELSVLNQFPRGRYTIVIGDPYE